MGTYDRAKQRTRARIRQAFWELYKTQKLDKITVKEVAETCGIHRATFYLHYADAYEILEEIEEGVLKELDDIQISQPATRAEIDQFTIKNYELYQRNWEYLHHLIRGQRDPGFSVRYKHKLVDMMCQIYQVDLDSMDEKARAIVHMTMLGAVEMFIVWADEPLFSFEDMIKINRGFMWEGVAVTMNREFGIQMKPSSCGETGEIKNQQHFFETETAQAESEVS